MRFFPSKQMRIVIVAGLFAVACCLIVKLGIRYYYLNGKIIDNWTGTIYSISMCGDDYRASAMFPAPEKFPWEKYAPVEEAPAK